MESFELNLDGLVGPTHNYAGLSEGNIASTKNALRLANPQAAALQGLAKMRFLYEKGLKQAILPPQQRPNLGLLAQLGFTGLAKDQIAKAKKQAPELLSAAYSASSMWAANAATVSASMDTEDKRVHFTAANLISNLHRHQEADFTSRLLKTIFADDHFFQHHLPLPRSLITSDEGAANHNRFCSRHSDFGVYLFAYGKQALSHKGSIAAPLRFPARQTLEASQAIARSHLLKEEQILFALQNPKAIDQGVFHNDVIAVANESVFLVHEEAFADQPKVLTTLRKKLNFPLNIIEVASKELSIDEAVSSYLFNSQLITDPDSTKMIIIAPKECEENPAVKNVLDRIINDSSNPVSEVKYFDLRQSMRNGGGPACLRLRVPLNEKELAAMHQGVMVNSKLLDTLEQWVLGHYRQELSADDLADPQLIEENYQALEELTQILKLGSIYPFQRA